MSEPDKPVPYIDLGLVVFWTWALAYDCAICAANVCAGKAGQAVGTCVLACLSLVMLIYNFRAVWLALRKSDPHYQKEQQP